MGWGGVGYQISGARRIQKSEDTRPKPEPCDGTSLQISNHARVSTQPKFSLGKLFIGGISCETSEDKLNEYFNYGDVLQKVVMRDKVSGCPINFGFVVFVNHVVLDRVLQYKNTIDGRTNGLWFQK
ncbi:hypothetical protein DVH24_036317 [Malus domestica]|uniref:RRM domain-containing protein n=1 Tax=Malus domestica TaxID=3750 RepID=A0A498IF38_MALDO|nr:hypothetical protein DVH24_036317 [Malus domestica]